jgi:4-hydroxybenzoate polyprenyltransferase
VAQTSKPMRLFGRRTGRLRPLLVALRPHQWAKNVLLFVPLFLARAFVDPVQALAVFVAFVSFSLCASSVYVLNDLFDVEADRQHPRKRKRPFAAGSLPLAYGPPLAALLAAVAFGLAFAVLPAAFVITLLVYMVVTCLYTAVLKRKLLVDVFTLAGLYTLRLFAGGAAADLAVSPWLLAFSIFIFTSLAFAKRYVELSRLAQREQTQAAGRAYRVADLDLLGSFGPTTGCLAVLVFALYINSGLPGFYTNTALLWLTCPLMLYWISRLWFLAKRGELDDDPVVFALTDRTSLAVGVAVGLLLLFAAPL